MKRFCARHAALCVALASCIATPAISQEVKILGGAGSGVGQTFFAPIMSGSGPARFGSIDPGSRQLLSLLARDDVRNELFISSRQREQLETLTKEGRGMPIRIEARGNSDSEAETSRRSAIDQIKTQIEERTKTRNEKAQGILSRKQVERTLELDLQWRGPLALADAEFAKKVGLSVEQHSEIEKMLAEYRTTQSQEMMAAMRDLNLIQQQSAQGEGPNGGRQESLRIMLRMPEPGKMKPEEKERLMKRDKTIEEARKEAGDKALTLLSPEQRRTWKNLLGKSFTFRQNEY